MYYIESHRSHLFGACKRGGMNKTMAIHFISYLLKLETTRGAKSLVSILKDRYHSIVSGEKSSFKLHADGTWVGPFRPISRIALRGRSGRRKALRILKCYGLFVHKAAVKGDYQRHSLRLARPEPVGLEMVPLVPWFTSLFQGLRSDKLSDTYPLTTKKAPTVGRAKIAEILMSPAEHITSLDMFPAFMVEFYERMAVLVGPDLPPVSHFQDLVPISEDTAGSVALLTKDRGLKLRLIANTNRMLNLALSPLHNYCFAFLKRHEQSFVYDQDAGEVWVSTKLGEGAVLTSLDLDSATDNIPMDVQLRMLLALCPSLETEIRMFSRIARMRFTTPFEGIDIRWRRGHPMGVAGSFPLFTTWLCSLMEYSGLAGKYAIVGDDLVFFSKYEQKVRGLLEYYQIPISFGKSLFDNGYIAEFVGRVIDSHGSLDVYKASAYTGKDPTGLIRQYGEAAIDIFKSARHLRVKTKDVLKLGHYYETHPEFREACLAFASSKDRLRLSGRMPPPLNRGGVSDTIIDKMVGNLLLNTEVDDNGERAVRFALNRVFDNGRLYNMLTGELARSTVVQSFQVRCNSKEEVAHRDTLRFVLDLMHQKGANSSAIEDVLNYSKESPGLDVVDVAKAEHIAKQNRMDPSDIEHGHERKVGRKKFSYYFSLSRAIKRAAKNSVLTRVFYSLFRQDSNK